MNQSSRWRRCQLLVLVLKARCRGFRDVLNLFWNCKPYQDVFKTSWYHRPHKYHGNTLKQKCVNCSTGQGNIQKKFTSHDFLLTKTPKRCFFKSTMSSWRLHEVSYKYSITHLRKTSWYNFFLIVYTYASNDTCLSDILA